MTEATGPQRLAGRNGSFAVAAFAFATFLAPALLAPGPVGLINVAGAVVALAIAAIVWRRYGDSFDPGSLAFRISVVGPGIVISAGLLFAMLLMQAWLNYVDATSSRMSALEAESTRFWNFPYSPFVYYAAPTPGLPPISIESARLVALTLTLSASFGAFFFVLTFLAAIPDYETLRRHALLWRGVRLDDPMERLRARGVRGLQPMWTPKLEDSKAPVSGRLFARAVAMTVCLGALAYAPYAMRLLMGMDQPELQRFFASAAFDGAFLPVWGAGLWGVCMIGALMHIAAYARLGFLLAGKR